MTQSEDQAKAKNKEDLDGKKSEDQTEAKNEHEAETNSNDKPYGGEWSIACWNAQGLLATSATKQHRKMAKAKQLATHRDMLVMTETHGNIGKCRACRVPLGYKAFWCSSGGGEAGVGIWIRKGFLETVVGDNGGLEHIDIDPGRTAVVRMWGSEGRVQIGMAYLQTGNSGGRAERTATMKRLAAELAKGGKTLTILAGDFNFVVDKMDRISGVPAEFTGKADDGEAQVIGRMLEQAGLKELEQSEFTYRFETCRSRIDRIYTNMKRYEWMDRDIGCVALDWNDNISRHRPIAGYRRGAGEKKQGEHPIQDHEVGGKEWRQRVKMAYLEKLRENEGRATGIQKLLMVKEMVKQVTRRMAHEKAAAPVKLKAADKLAWAMRYIRAVEKGDWRRTAEARAAFPAISAKVGGHSDKDVQSQNLEVGVHTWILELAKDTITEEIEEVKQMQAQGDECGAKRGKENIIRKLKRLHGGTTGAIKAMKSSAGDIRTDAKGMIEVLQEHWSEVFQKRGVEEDLLEDWLKEMYPLDVRDELQRKRSSGGGQHWSKGLPPEGSGQWDTRRGDLEKAIKQSKNSAPGPDGIPHKVWKELGEFGATILWNAMEELHEANAPDLLKEAYGTEHEFNEGIMVCLPKTATGETEDGEDVYVASNTRPLAIGNTDNRLMCGAARMRWEMIFNEWVSTSQKGFLPSRSMLSNVLTVDHEAMKISLEQETGAIVLFDFKAAFPSLERAFMIRTLEWLGMPEKQLNLIRTMYDRTRVKIRAAGEEGEGFEMTRGIRQGCPLSPLIFAVVVDILLRRLSKNLEDKGLTRAFADDTAAVLQNFFESMPAVAGLFGEYARISGLFLNYSKTVVIPLWMPREKEYENIGKLLRNLGDGWDQVLTRSCAKYLGFLVGPGRNDEVWTKPAGKWLSRAKGWGGAGVGLQYDALLYNVFCASVLTFLAQLEPVPELIREQELHVMLHLAKGPTAWASASDLWRMGEDCSIGRSFQCMQARGQAAMLRTYHFEKWERPIKDEVTDLIHCESRTSQHDRLVHWREWYGRSFPRALLHNKTQMAEKKITVEGIRKKFSLGVDVRREQKKFRNEFQMEAARCNLPFFLDNWHQRVAHKLVRWKLPGNRHHHVDRAISNLRNLGRLVAPRVAAATWGLTWNRWCTARRFQSRAPCVLGCGKGEDSIEHYWCCPVAREAGKRVLRVDGDADSRKANMLGVARFANREEQTCWALLTYAVYMTTNASRKGGGQTGKVQELSQHIRQAVEGHKSSAACLTARWLR
jgi:hypothetical protein